MSEHNRLKALRARQAVSPIIATILLVAITVVIAAVLYVLVSGYLKGASPAPLDLQLQGEIAGHNILNTIHWLNFSVVTVSKGLDTGVFGFKIVNPNGNLVVGWNVSLEFSNTVVATFAAGASFWSQNVAVNGSAILSFNTGSQNLVGTTDDIDAIGLGNTPVSGGFQGL